MKTRFFSVFEVERLDLKSLALSRAGFSPPLVSWQLGGLKSALPQRLGIKSLQLVHS
jgi:hypothetical protein